MRTSLEEIERLLRYGMCPAHRLVQQPCDTCQRSLDAIEDVRELVAENATLRSVAEGRALPDDVVADLDVLRCSVAAAERAADAAEQALEVVRRDERLRCARLLEEYRRTKPRAEREDGTGTPAQRAHRSWKRGFADGERSGLYSAICRLDPEGTVEIGDPKASS